MTQRAQLFLQEKVIRRVLEADSDTPLSLPLPLRLLRLLPWLAHLPGRLIGVGARPEHVREIRLRS